MSNLEFHWYIIRCLSGKETKVRESIIQETQLAGCSHKVDKIIVPTESVIAMRKGVKYTRDKKIFPGYMLLYMQYDDEIGSIIYNVPFCGGILSGKRGVEPVPLRPEEVDKIIKRLSGDSESSSDEAKIHYAIEDNVRIIDGPFRNFDGVVQEVNRDRMKLKILVSIFGRKTSVEVNASQVSRS